MGPRAPPAPLLWAHPRYWAAAAHGAVPAARRDKKTSAAGGSGDGTLSALSKHFGAIYGGRWPGLWAAMQARTRHVAWVTPFEPAAAAAAAVDGWAPAFPDAPGVPACTPPAAARQRAAGTQEQWGCSGGGGGSGGGSGGGASGDTGDRRWEAGPGGSSAVQQRTGQHAYGQELRGREQREEARPLRHAYLLDQASLYPALALEPRRGQSVLDMCASPGGKSLVLAAQLFGGGWPQDAGSGCGGGSRCGSSSLQDESGEGLDASSRGAGGRSARAGAGGAAGLLVCNERSRARRAELASVLRAYLPRGLIASGAVRTAGRDASRWPAAEFGAFDRVLLDAPCSSERHLARRVAGGGRLARVDWTVSRSKRNSDAQLALLLSVRGGARACEGPLGRRPCSMTGRRLGSFAGPWSERRCG
jgi:hypothetical protein